MRSKKLEILKQKLKLTKQQRQIIVGKLLGDGHLETQNGGRAYRLKIEHSLKQKQYVEWLYDIFRAWVTTPPKIRPKQAAGRAYTNYAFSTVSHSSLRFYGQQFYPTGHKQVPRAIHRLLQPLSLAVWFMDDGSRKSKIHRARLLNTQGFAKGELGRLQKVLEDKFGISTSLRKQREGWQILIPGDQWLKFKRIITPYIIPTMRYKIED